MAVRLVAVLVCMVAVLGCVLADNSTCTVTNRRDCGHVGTDQQQCTASGCCWQPVNPNPSNLPWCFYPNTGPSPPSPSPSPSPPSPSPPSPSPPSPSPPSPSPPSPPSPPGPLPGCNTFGENQCQGDNIITPASFEDHRWYTPRRGEPHWQPGFQDYANMAAAINIQYDTTLTSANVTVRYIHRLANATVKLYINGTAQSSLSFTASQTKFTTPLELSLHASDGSVINLETLDFRWNRATLKERPGDYRSGQKGAIVEMFGWPHRDVEKECAFVAAAGYLGVKIFPPQEQVMSLQPFQNDLNPWYFMYQPVSYRLAGRMGTRDELRHMINTCRSLGVRVYADAVVNHMVGGGNDANPYHRNGNGGGCTYWPNKNSSAGLDGSPFFTQDFIYTINNHTGKPASQEFPAAMYGPQDFHCERALNSWTDPLDLNAGWLTGLTDLNTERTNVQERIADYITDLLSIGFSGIRVDAAKHIQPPDLAAIFAKVKRNMGGALPDDFVAWLEVLLGGEGDLLMCNADSGYNYGAGLVTEFQKAGLSETDIDKIKIWNSGYPKEPELGTCTIKKSRSAVQNDDADQQNPGSTSRDMGNAGCVLIKGCDPSEHRGFEVELFQNPPGADDNANDYPIRMILSSYYWVNGSEGVPDGLSDCSRCTTTCAGCRSVPYQPAFDGSSQGYDSTYTRVHRDSAIIAAMRSWMQIDNQTLIKYH